jgi:hypothetical protein
MMIKIMILLGALLATEGALRIQRLGRRDAKRETMYIFARKALKRRKETTTWEDEVVK